MIGTNLPLGTYEPLAVCCRCASDNKTDIIMFHNNNYYVWLTFFFHLHYFTLLDLFLWQPSVYIESNLLSFAVYNCV